MRMRLDLGQQPGVRHHRDDPLARDEAVLTVDRGDEPGVVVIALQALEESKLPLSETLRFGVQNVDRARAFGFVPPADLEVVEVVRGRDLDRAGAFLGIGIFVADDGDQPPDQRQADLLADQMLDSAGRPDGPPPPCRRASSPGRVVATVRRSPVSSPSSSTTG